MPEPEQTIQFGVKCVTIDNKATVFNVERKVDIRGDIYFVYRAYTSIVVDEFDSFVEFCRESEENHLVSPHDRKALALTVLLFDQLRKCMEQTGMLLVHEV